MTEEDVSYCANCVLYKVEVERLRALVERAGYPITMALNCSAHPWHGSDDARRWLMDAAKEAR